VKIDVVSNRLFSARDHFVLDRTLAPSQAAYFRVSGVSDSAVMEHRWWRDRHTLKCVAAACLAFAFDYLHGPPPKEMDTWDPVAHATALP
jgi:hypothetical protein